MKRFASLLLFTLTLSLLAGCADKLPRFVWPPPPEQPRLEYVGRYFNEDDLRSEWAQGLAKNLLGQSISFLFRTPFGIVSDGQGLVYVSDIHLANVVIFDFNKRKVDYLTASPLFTTPLGLALDGKRNLYIADGGTNKVYVFSAERRPLRVFGEGHLKNPAYLALREDLGRIYVSDGADCKIAVFDMNGKHLFDFGKRGAADGEFNSPQGLAFDRQGRLFVADSLNARVQVFDSEGKYLSKFGTRGDQPGQLENPKDIAFDSDGHLYLLEGRRSTLSIYDDKGTLLLVLGIGRASNSDFAFAAPKALHIDARDRIFVAESLNKRFSVWQYLSKGYLGTNPYTDADRQELIDYMEKLKAEEQKKQKK